MHIVELTPETLRFLEQPPLAPPAAGFVWIYLERDELDAALPALQQAAQRLGGSTLLDVHLSDLRNEAHPSHYDFTSIYDLVVFRRLAGEQEAVADHHADMQPALADTTAGASNETRAKARSGAARSPAALAHLNRIHSRAVAFVVFDQLLVSVHPAGCPTAKAFLQRYLNGAVQADGLPVAPRIRLPATPSDLMLRMVNTMVDSYLELRKQLSAELERWQIALLRPQRQGADWNALLAARSRLHALEALCEEQHDAMQEWLDNLLEQPWPKLNQTERDGLIARSRDIIEHIERVVHHVRRMEHGAETVVQIHFSAQSQRTNEIMRTLTALTAIFLPLNLVTGVFGMNFGSMPWISHAWGFWLALGVMGAVALTLGLVFWHKRYIARTQQ